MKCVSVWLVTVFFVVFFVLTATATTRTLEEPPRPMVVYIRESPQIPNPTAPTRSIPIDYTTVGYLESASQGMLPLYARPSPTHRHRYNYYTRNANEYAVRLPVIRDGRDCTNRLGCDELYDRDTVDVPGIQAPLTVHLYSKEFC